MMHASSLRLASGIVWVTTALFLLATLFVALVIPIHAQDALTFGERRPVVHGGPDQRMAETN